MLRMGVEAQKQLGWWWCAVCHKVTRKREELDLGIERRKLLLRYRNPSALVELNILKNLTGSAIAGALGGFNALAANIVSAIFIATGQDPVQNIESSHCITMMEAVSNGKDLHVSVTMPSIEVGTVGGGAQLASQSACLNLLGAKGLCQESLGSNVRLLVRVVASSVLAGELSLMSAIAAGQLVKGHMKYNRSNMDIASTV